MTTMQSITQSALQERLVMEEELKKALDRCKELEQSSVPAVDGVDIFECYQQEYLKQLESTRMICLNNPMYLFSKHTLTNCTVLTFNHTVPHIISPPFSQ